MPVAANTAFWLVLKDRSIEPSLKTNCSTPRKVSVSTVPVLVATSNQRSYVMLPAAKVVSVLSCVTVSVAPAPGEAPML